jgi:hypothetical protein
VAQMLLGVQFRTHADIIQCPLSTQLAQNVFHSGEQATLFTPNQWDSPFTGQVYEDLSWYAEASTNKKIKKKFEKFLLIHPFFSFYFNWLRLGMEMVFQR